MADIRAEEGALEKGAEAVRDARDNIDRRIKDVRGQLQVLGGFWSGSAATSFAGLMARWDEKSTKLNDVLIELEANLSQTRRDQIASEESHQQTIAGLGSMMS